MPDAPDGYQYRPESTRAVLGDLGEHAVRVGSPITFDRRGTVIWYDTVQYGLTPWTESGSGTNSSSKLILGGGHFGPYLVEMTADSDGERWRQMWHPMPLIEINKWGLVVSFAVTDDFDYLSFSLNRYDGTYRYQGRIKVVFDPPKLQYRGSDGDDHDIETIPNPVWAYHTFHWIKFVADYETLEYVRVIYNGVEYPLPGIAIYKSDSDDIPKMTPYITVRGRSGYQDKMLVCAVILTIDEP